jgi:hypothetical protein
MLVCGPFSDANGKYNLILKWPMLLLLVVLFCFVLVDLAPQNRI